MIKRGLRTLELVYLATLPSAIFEGFAESSWPRLLLIGDRFVEIVNSIKLDRRLEGLWVGGKEYCLVDSVLHLSGSPGTVMEADAKILCLWARIVSLNVKAVTTFRHAYPDQ